MSPRTLFLCAAVLTLASTARAAAVDPCKKADELTTKDQILAAFPPNDAAWSNFLMDRRPQILQQNGEWMEYRYGGYVSALPSSIKAAFAAFCEAKAQAADAAKKAARPAAAPAAPPPAAPQPPRRVEGQAAAAKEKDDGLLKKASAFFGSLTTAAPAEPTAAPADCTALCGTAQSCKDAGMDGGHTSLEFQCRKAAADASAAKCSCAG